jgi:tetratricopeptide (TPR) repeat protein
MGGAILLLIYIAICFLMLILKIKYTDPNEIKINDKRKNRLHLFLKRHLRITSLEAIYLNKSNLKVKYLIMKTIFFSLVMLLSFKAMAQSDNYVEEMQKSIVTLDSSLTTQELQSVAIIFENIADTEKTQWLPYYYAGLAYSRIGWSDPQIDKDANSEKILALCGKAEALEKNAEIYSLRNMAATQQMMVDPQSRWMSYGHEARGALQKGLELDPNNPRLYYLQAMSVFGTPEQFGGGKEKARPILEKSIELFKAEHVKPLYPHWGLSAAQGVLSGIN